MVFELVVGVCVVVIAIVGAVVAFAAADNISNFN